MHVSMASILDFMATAMLWLQNIDFYIGPYHFSLWDCFMDMIVVGAAFECIYLLWHNGNTFVKD